MSAVFRVLHNSFWNNQYLSNILRCQKFWPRFVSSEANSGHWRLINLFKGGLKWAGWLPMFENWMWASSAIELNHSMNVEVIVGLIIICIPLYAYCMARRRQIELLKLLKGSFEDQLLVYMLFLASLQIVFIIDAILASYKISLDLSTFKNEWSGDGLLVLYYVLDVLLSFIAPDLLMSAKKLYWVALPYSTEWIDLKSKNASLLGSFPFSRIQREKIAVSSSVPSLLYRIFRPC